MGETLQPVTTCFNRSLRVEHRLERLTGDPGGSKAGVLQATLSFALARDDLRDDLWNYLSEVMHAKHVAQ